MSNATDPKIESYLTRLDRALGPVSVSGRADIVLEIKSHIMDTLERHPEQNVQQVIEALGEPEVVANRYLIERGLKPAKPPRTPIVKWLMFGFLGTFAIFALTFMIALWKFTPLIEVDEKNERVRILGGAITVDGTHGSFSSGDFEFRGNANRVKGERAIDPAQDRAIELLFTNGRLEIEGSTDGLLRWSCKTSSLQELLPVSTDGILRFDLSGNGFSRCDVKVPRGVPVKISGSNGRIEVEDVAADLDISLANGRVTFDPEQGQAYVYDVSSRTGRVGNFVSSTDPNAIKIKVRIENGIIENDSHE